MTEPIGIARRITFHQARRYFEYGNRILVSECGHEVTRPLYPRTTVHTNETITWDELVTQVRMWRNRYPNQRYYVVNTIDDPALEPLRSSLTGGFDN